MAKEGIGKTYITLSIANAVASGNPLPFQNETVDSASVLLLSAEDSLSFTIKPRLVAMGANCEKIFAVDEPFTLNDDGFDLLENAIAETKARLVIIDPIFSFVGNKDINRDNEIRLIANKLIEIAARYDCAIVGVRHIGKSKGFGDARSAGLGGIGWCACCRSELLVGSNPDNPHKKALCQTKNNLGEMFSKSIGFEIRGVSFIDAANQNSQHRKFFQALKAMTIKRVKLKRLLF